MTGVAAAPDGRIITGSDDDTVKMWRDGACERTIQAHTSGLRTVAMLPGGARFVSGANDCTAKLWTLDGALERTFEVHNLAICIAALPDGVHFVVGTYEKVKLYHVDGTLVHTFEGHTNYAVYSVAVTRDGQHIISGAADKLVKVWSVATKSLVSTCEGHTSFVNAVAAMPDGQRILSGGHDRPSACGSSTAPSRTPSRSCTPYVTPSWRCPTTSTRSPRRATTQSSSSTSTTAPSYAPSRTTHNAPGDFPGADARRPPLRQRLERPAPPASPTTASRRIELAAFRLKRAHNVIVVLSPQTMRTPMPCLAPPWSSLSSHATPQLPAAAAQKPPPSSRSAARAAAAAAAAMLPYAGVACAASSHMANGYAYAPCASSCAEKPWPVVSPSASWPCV